MNEHIVDFHEWCPKCKYCDLAPDNYNADSYNICDECLSEPVNEDSRRPVYFTKKENKDEGKS